MNQANTLTLIQQYNHLQHSHVMLNDDNDTHITLHLYGWFSHDESPALTINTQQAQTPRCNKK